MQTSEQTDYVRSLKQAITVVIPTLNEEQGIGEVIDQLKDAGYDNILVVDGYSNDRTEEIAKAKNVQFVAQHGTGKTTQADFVMNELRKRGLRTRKAWVRGRHIFAFAISQVLLKLGYSSTIAQIGAPGGNILDSRKLPNKRFWSLVEFLSVMPLALTRVRIPLLLGYYVVAERYVVDTVVYNSYFLGRHFDPYGRILLLMIPKNSLLIHLDATEEDVLSRRKGDILSEDFVHYQLEQYRRLALKLKALSIDTSTNDIQSVSEQIAKWL
jgi:glycosyltransferase involved in cell wall biosynthesis